MTLYSLIISLTLMGLVVLVTSFIQTEKHNSFIKKRIIKILSVNDKGARETVVLSPLTDIMVKKVDLVVERFVPENIIRDISKKIETANLKNYDVSRYFLLKILIVFFILIFVPICLSIAKIELNFGIIVLVMIIGFFAPDYAMKNEIEKRYRMVIRELPNFIDVLKVCIEAGLDLEGALNKIVQNSSGILQEEAAHAMVEVQMGRSVSEALQRMSARINYPDFSSFITVIIQSAQMGISISSVLKVQSHQINLKYLQDMRSRAARIPVLILIPMTLFILPALLMVVLGPALISIMSSGF